MNNVYDVIIIGSGPGGLSAGLYTSRSKLKTLIIEKKSFGGQILNTHIIENYPGSLKDETGSSLAARMVEQCKVFGAELVKDEVLDLELEGEIKIIKCKNNIYKSKAVIIATGCKSKRLNIENEDKLLGKGISYCAICDGHLFEDLDVFVLGCGESALQESIYLSKFAKKVTILSRHDDSKASKYIKEKCNQIENISIINNVEIVELLGDNILDAIVIKDLNTDEKITFKATDEDEIIGLFVFIGLVAQTDLFKAMLDLDEQGYIITDENMQTNLKGVYAVGDCRSKYLRQVVVACSEGAIAATSAERYIDLLDLGR